MTSKYISTDNGNKIHKESKIHGIQNIILKGSTILEQTTLRGDLRRQGLGNAISISIGSNCYIQSQTIIRPPYKIYKALFSYYPLKIGNYVHIGKRSVIEAASIGNHCYIGNDCIIGSFCILKDCCLVPDGSIIPPGTVVNSFTVFGSKESLEESFKSQMEFNLNSIINNIC